MASTFSYAQAAKGIATPAPANKSAPSSVTSTKEGGAVTAPAPADTSSTGITASNWAEDVEIESRPGQNTAGRESRPQIAPTDVPKETRSVDASSASSPDLGASSSSTITKDDDVSSIPNTSSESTWDNKSQASTSLEKAAEPTEKTSEKVKKDKDVIVKPLQEAPPPAVNPWKMRADELKAKASKTPVMNGASQPSVRRSDQALQEKSSPSDARSKGREDGALVRNNAREIETRKNNKGKFAERDAKAGSSVLPPPPNRDQESWPTPETAIDEDRKKAQEKGERVDKERKENATSGKHEWVKVPYTPSVVFNTPLPNAANPRRGGRPGARGGAQSSTRPTGPAANGVGQAERNGSVPEVSHVDQAKQERSENTPMHDGFSKEKRSGNPAMHGMNGQQSEVNGDTASRYPHPATSEPNAPPRRACEAAHVPGQNTTYPRQYPNRANKGRRGDFSGNGDRRRNGENLSSKDNTSDEVRQSTSTQTDAVGEGDRHSSSLQDVSNGHGTKHGRFTSFSSGRDRGRGGRGARASYSNGHQFSNGNQSMHASAFPAAGPQSPTTFNPGNTSFFPQSQGKYTRNGIRSQSLNADAYRFAPYQNATTGSQLPPYAMYDYNMVQPISPIPFPYGVDYHALIAVLTTQV